MGVEPKRPAILVEGEDDMEVPLAGTLPEVIEMESEHGDESQEIQTNYTQVKTERTVDDVGQMEEGKPSVKNAAFIPPPPSGAAAIPGYIDHDNEEVDLRSDYLYMFIIVVLWVIAVLTGLYPVLIFAAFFWKSSNVIVMYMARATCVIGIVYFISNVIVIAIYLTLFPIFLVFVIATCIAMCVAQCG